MANPKPATFFKEWLEKLQQESWQLELLISGLALFGIYESRAWINELDLYTDQNQIGMVKYIFNFLNSILHVGWKIFFVNLLIHIILRSLWIGAIGLRYVSEDIDYQGLKYSIRFTSLLEKRVGEFDDFIEKLERICSVLFAYTFLLFLLFVSAMLFFLEFILLIQLSVTLLGTSNPVLIFGAVIFFMIGMIVLLDFVTLGLFKKIEDPTVSKIYSVIFKFYSYATLSFLYAPILYNFLDNKYTKRLFFLSFPYILLVTFSSSLFETNNFEYFPPNYLSTEYGERVSYAYYDDLRYEYSNEINTKLKKSLPSVTINKFTNDEPFIKIFLKMSPFETKDISESSDVQPYFESGLSFSLFSDNRKNDSFYDEVAKEKSAALKDIRQVRREIKNKARKEKSEEIKLTYNNQIDSLDNIIAEREIVFEKKILELEALKLEKTKKAIRDEYVLKLNDIDIKDELDCYFFTHPNNEEKGLLCLMPIDSLSYGKHTFSYKSNIQILNPVNGDIMDRSRNIKLPFYRVRSH